jgi:hypothetical protein
MAQAFKEGTVPASAAQTNKHSKSASINALVFAKIQPLTVLTDSQPNLKN